MVSEVVDPAGKLKINRPETVGRVGIILYGLFFVLQALFVIYMLINFWPETSEVASQPQEISIFLGLFKFKLLVELRMIIVVALCGALGSFVHSATSFITYVGNRQFVKSWRMWYLLRPLIGASLALVFYFLIRGGLFAAPSTLEDLNMFGVAGISGLVGMFSKEAIDKLHEIFQNLFKTEKEPKRADKLSNDR